MMNEHKNSLYSEIDRLYQSEREGWRYADELEKERKQLQTMLNTERDENEKNLKILKEIQLLIKQRKTRSILSMDDTEFSIMVEMLVENRSNQGMK